VLTCSTDCGLGHLHRRGAVFVFSHCAGSLSLSCNAVVVNHAMGLGTLKSLEVGCAVCVCLHYSAGLCTCVAEAHARAGHCMKTAAPGWPRDM
jgi:hypothetical protein